MCAYVHFVAYGALVKSNQAVNILLTMN